MQFTFFLQVVYDQYVILKIVSDNYFDIFLFNSLEPARPIVPGCFLHCAPQSPRWYKALYTWRYLLYKVELLHANSMVSYL